MADDPDAGDREELRALLNRAYAGADAGAVTELRDRFGGRLQFGTAGLRGAMGAGPNRMNRAVVRAATAAVAGGLLAGKARAGAWGACPPAALSYAAAGVRGQAAGRDGRGDDHGEPQPGRGQRVQALPE